MVLRSHAHESGLGSVNGSAEALRFEMKEDSLGTSELLTTKLQETARFEQVEPAAVEEPLTTKALLEFEMNDDTQGDFPCYFYQVSLPAIDILLQEAYLRDRGIEGGVVEALAVSIDVHRLLDEWFISKVPLEFEVVRLEELTKSARVEDKAVAMLVSSVEAEKLVYEGSTDSQGYELLQGIDEVPSYETPTVRRFGSRRSTIESLQKDIYLVIGASGFGSRHIVEHLARADAISVLDVVQRHRDVSFYIGDTTGRRDVLDVLKKSGATCIVRAALLQHSAKDPSVCYKVNVEGTRTIIVAAIAAGVLYQHSRTRIQIGDNNDIESKLESESATAKLNESLHCALPPIFVTTEYHRTPHSSAQPLGPYVTPPDAGSILPAFNSPFDPHELEHPTIRSQVDGQAFFIANGESDYFWDVTTKASEDNRV
ncbi:hypothetical protein F5J12DRAFT_887471 [Pisolithus orientalis]|uniref:uncharacterized protein n=1 Tax=Pisolithus orientalis TaxID=936130 RepID=UPI0022246F62|nr:uncharacterized protein F5J12DRAFT_887471 [Pisolithus orientalis]KAI6032565.1 hypothetical protein F5J12DRAFT_887471 [Pisolithus orientalis]